MSVHKLIYYDPRGNYRATFDTFFRLEYLKRENDYGSMYLDLPPTVDPNFFAIDGTFEIQRSWDGGKYKNDTKTMWLVRLARNKISENGQKLTHVLAYDANQIIDRRIVAYAAKSSQSKKTNMRADTMILQIMRENFGSSAAGARNISSVFYIPPDNPTTYAPLISKSFAWQKVLPLLQDICDECAQQGFYMCFDVEAYTPNKYYFGIYFGARGTDRGSTSKSPLVFSVENGGLSYSSYARDYTEERNFVYAGGSGEEDKRVIKTAQDDGSIGLSPVNRSEDFISHSDEDPNIVQSAANSRVREAAAKKILNGHIQQIRGRLFGVDYGYGDIINVQHFGHSIDVHIDTVSIVVDSSQQESIKINSRNFPDSEY